MTLTEFLKARIAEDEAVARSVEEHLIRSLRSIARDAPLPGGEVLHIVRWDPARVLAECQAKRRLIELCETSASQAALFGEAVLKAQVIAFDASLHVLALPYSDHPDYRAEWAV